MESTKAIRLEDIQRQAEIRQQIAALQAQLGDVEDSFNFDVDMNDQSHKEEVLVLEPSTPSPKKRKISHEQHIRPIPALITKVQPNSTQKALSQTSKINIVTPASSTVISQLHALAKLAKHGVEPLARSNAFSEPAAEPKELSLSSTDVRDDRLAIVESLDIGPANHKAPDDDPLFEKFEPNSGIHLTSRKLPHEDFQDYLRGRYYLSPSKLYSIIRLLPNKQGYDVPVEGDWVTIAVVAERGPIKLTSAPGSTSRTGASDADSDGEYGDSNIKKITKDGKQKQKQKQKGKPDEPYARKTSRRKFMNIKLVDFGHRSHSSSTAKMTIKGEALLTLLLFEADSFDVLKESDGYTRKLYKGGSGGAFEQFAKLREGMVIALLNPKILRPFQQGNTNPHPVSNILALTPESAESIVIIGQARDLGMCSAIKRDGKVCGGWCYKRISDVCEYHVQTAVQSRRAARAEFSIGTSGMSAGTASKRKSMYDPQRQWGLKPETRAVGGNGGADATYVLSGQIVSSRGPDYINESVGRESQSRAKRLMEQKETDKMLKQLLSTDRDPDGAAAVVKKARIIVKKDRTVVKDSNNKGKTTDRDEDTDNDESVEDAYDDSIKAKKRSYPVEIIKRLGFDPTAKLGQKTSDAKKKQGPLKPRQSEVQLGPPPGQRLKSNMMAPKSRRDDFTFSEVFSSENRIIPATIEEDEDDLYIEDGAIKGRSKLLPLSADENRMADNPTSIRYESDSDLEIGPPI